mgnify:CR=1 FL=1
MNFFVMRRGQRLGPYPEESVEAMASSGELRAGDLLAYEGEQNWQPVSRFIELRQQRAQSPDASATEVPAAEATMPTKTTFMRRGDETGDEHLSPEEREVIAGGRFVIYRYCWSLVVSFKHSSAPILLRAGDDGVGPAFRYSLVSALLGWWGIPGPIWAISTIRHNVGGGKDVTMEELTRRVGQGRAASACARHQPSARPGILMRTLPGLMIILSLSLWLGLGRLAWNVAHRETDEPEPGPGSGEFIAADAQLLQAKRSQVFGNDLKAIELADAFNKTLKEAYLAAAQNAPGVAAFTTNAPMLSTYCELHRDRVVFLTTVPGLNNMPEPTRKQLAADAWKASSLALTDIKAGFAGLRVAVGVRSPAKYEFVMSGRYQRDFEANNTGLRGTSEGNRSKGKLYAWFLPADQLEAWKEE